MFKSVISIQYFKSHFVVICVIGSFLDFHIQLLSRRDDMVEQICFHCIKLLIQLKQPNPPTKISYTKYRIVHPQTNITSSYFDIRLN